MNMSGCIYLSYSSVVRHWQPTIFASTTRPTLFICSPWGLQIQLPHTATAEVIHTTKDTSRFEPPIFFNMHSPFGNAFATDDASTQLRSITCGCDSAVSFGYAAISEAHSRESDIREATIDFKYRDISCVQKSPLTTNESIENISMPAIK